MEKDARMQDDWLLRISASAQAARARNRGHGHRGAPEFAHLSLAEHQNVQPRFSRRLP